MVTSKSIGQNNKVITFQIALKGQKVTYRNTTNNNYQPLDITTGKIRELLKSINHECLHKSGLLGSCTVCICTEAEVVLLFHS